MIEEVRAAFGRLDALVNNAGTTVATPPFELDSLSMEDWDRVSAVNVRGTLQVTRAAVPLLREARTRRWSTWQASWACGPGHSPSLTRQAGPPWSTLTRTVAGALGPGIRVNAVAPERHRRRWWRPHPKMGFSGH